MKMLRTNVLPASPPAGRGEQCPDGSVQSCTQTNPPQDVPPDQRLNPSPAEETGLIMPGAVHKPLD